MSQKLTKQMDVPAVLKAVRRHEAHLVDRTRTLVEIESPSSDKAAVDHAHTIFASWAQAAGATVRRHSNKSHGDSIEAKFAVPGSTQKPLLLLGHLDTVWNVGTLQRMPWKITRERISGPGVLDMKAGVVMALTAMEVLAEMHLLKRPVTIMIHGDEEIGSPASRRLTEFAASRSSAVYVMEPAQGEMGSYKTARKGVGLYRLSITGVASHSGVDFEAGHSAVLELARQIEVLDALTDLTRGLTVNPGLIGGGTASNVVAAEAWAELDVRVRTRQQAVRIERALQALKPFDKNCALMVRGGMNRPPMERTTASLTLFKRAQAFATQIGLGLEQAATGGASDGNFTAALGTPTLDGMGAVGAGAHASHEHLLRKHLAPRTALLAAMIAGG